MSEYTFSDLIVDPETPGVENLIGKEVYYNSVPSRCVLQANKGLGVGILKEIRKDDYFPFYVETPIGDTVYYSCYSCIIPKKEESKPEPKYAPFKNAKEFIKAYQSAPGCLNEEDCYLSKHGLWLKEKGHSSDSEVYLMVNEIQNDGVFIGHADVDLGFANAYTKFTSWSKLYQRCTFLDGSPCGKLEDLK